MFYTANKSDIRAKSMMCHGATTIWCLSQINSVFELRQSRCQSIINLVWCPSQINAVPEPHKSTVRAKSILVSEPHQTGFRLRINILFDYDLKILIKLPSNHLEVAHNRTLHYSWLGRKIVEVRLPSLTTQTFFEFFFSGKLQ